MDTDVVQTTIQLERRIRQLAKKHGLNMSFESRKAITAKVERLEREEQESLKNHRGEG
jgi:hypothetical protein